jgi:hypothetical protein
MCRALPSRCGQTGLLRLSFVTASVDQITGIARTGRCAEKPFAHTVEETA